MQLFTLVLWGLTLITIAILQPSNARAASYSENQYRREIMALYARILNGEQSPEDNEENMDTRGASYNAPRRGKIVSFLLEIFSYANSNNRIYFILVNMITLTLFI